MSQDENGLTFSQVLIIDVDSVKVVPDGKIWKVVSLMPTSFSYNINHYDVYIDNVPNVIYRTDDIPNLPFWIPSNSLVYSYDDIRLNIIEFNTN